MLSRTRSVGSMCVHSLPIAYASNRTGLFQRQIASNILPVGTEKPLSFSFGSIHLLLQFRWIRGMTAKQFYDWQTGGGTDDVMRFVDCLERADIEWCAIGGIAINHWAKEQMVTRDVDFVVATGDIERTIAALADEGFSFERFPWSVNFRGRSEVGIQLSMEELYRDFPSRSVPADVHGILLRVASLEDTVRGKVRAWNDADLRPSKRIKDLGDIARLVEAHPRVWDALPDEIRERLRE